MNNRGAIPTRVGDILFPSQLEAATYLILKANYDGEIQSAATGCTFKVLLKPATSRFPTIYWKPDFFLPRYDLYIEAKGRFESEWVLRMKFLDYVNPDVFSRLLMVCENSSRIPFKGSNVLNLKQLKRFLEELK